MGETYKSGLQVTLPRYHDEPMWYDWIYEGFKRLGYGDRAKYTSTDLSSNRVGYTYPMKLLINNKIVLYDFIDHTQTDRQEIPSDVRFKIQCLNSEIPIPQVCAKVEFDIKRHDYIGKTKKYDVCGVFRTTNFALRCSWLDIVLKMNLNSILSLTQTPGRPEVPERLRNGSYSYYEHLNLQAQSKICLAIPGIGYEVGTAWSFRHSEILGICGFMISPKTKCKLPPYKGCWVECDTKDLKDVIKYYLKNEKERQEIARNGLRYYETYIKPDSMAKYMVEHAL